MKLYIARNKNITRYKKGKLCLYETKPYNVGEFWTSSGNYYVIDRDLFPEVTFENSPQQIEFKLVEI
jgi:hypothetical protein